MTVTDTQPTATAPTTGAGRVTRVIGSVIDVEFPSDRLPAIHNALAVDAGVGETRRPITLEVQLQIGDNEVRCIALKPTDGVRRGSPVHDSGSPITVPVGQVTKGHVWNVTGEVLNVDPSTVEVTERWPIHRDPPPFDALQPETKMLETGIKVIDLLTPYVQAADRPVRWRASEDRAHPGDDLPHRPQLRWHLRLRRCGELPVRATT